MGRGKLYIVGYMKKLPLSMKELTALVDQIANSDQVRVEYVKSGNFEICRPYCYEVEGKDDNVVLIFELETGFKIRITEKMLAECVITGNTVRVLLNDGDETENETVFAMEPFVFTLYRLAGFNIAL